LALVVGQGDLHRRSSSTTLGLWLLAHNHSLQVSTADLQLGTLVGVNIVGERYGQLLRLLTTVLAEPGDAAAPGGSGRGGGRRPASVP
jgi:hypothetical protein